MIRLSLLVVVLAVLSVGCGGAPFTAFDPTLAEDGGTFSRTDGALANPSEATAVKQDSAPDSSAPDVDGSGEAGSLDAVADAPDAGARVCVSDLSGVGTGDFRVSFTIATTYSPPSYMALLNQRTRCDDTRPGWDVWMTAAGDLGVEVFDGAAGAYDNVTHDGRVVNDGAPHRVAVSRSGGGTVLTVSVDGVSRVYPGETSMSLGAMAPLNAGSDPTCTGVSPLSGALTDVCVAR